VSTIKNILKFKSIKSFQKYLDSCSSNELYQINNEINRMNKDLQLIFIKYQGKLLSQIVYPSLNKINNLNEDLYKDELKIMTDKVIKMGFSMKKECDKVTKINQNDEIHEECSNISDLKEVVLSNYQTLVNPEASFYKSFYNCCEELYLRLINIPILYYQYLFHIDSTGNKKVDKLLATRNKDRDENYELLVGLKDQNKNWIYSNSYERFVYTIYTTLSIINPDFWNINLY